MAREEGAVQQHWANAAHLAMSRERGLDGEDKSLRVDSHVTFVLAKR